MAKKGKQDEWIPTSCNMCFNGCSIRAHVVDGVVEKLEGNPDSPTGGGRLCGKGATGIMQLYDPDRVTKPLVRTNPKKGFDQDPGWKEISWDEAYEIAAKKWQEAYAKGPTNITTYNMVANNSMFYIFMLWSKGAMGVNWTGSDICGAGIHRLYDQFSTTGNAAPDYRLCKMVINFGTNAGVATRHGFNMSAHRLAEAREKGCKLVTVDPYMGASAQASDQWVPIRPGTDGALAMSMGYVLVHELGIYDAEYLKKYTNAADLVDLETGLIMRDEETNKPLVWDPTDNTAKLLRADDVQDQALWGVYEVNGRKCSPGFQLYADKVRQFTPEYAETITTVPAETIRQLSREFGETAGIGQTIVIDGVTMPYRPVSVDLFSGVTRHKHAFLTEWAVLFLNMLVGAYNVPGGMISFSAKCTGNDHGFVSWDPASVDNEDLMLGHNGLYYNTGTTSDFQKSKDALTTPAAHWDKTGQDLGLLGLQPFNPAELHFTYMTQGRGKEYGQKDQELLFCFAGNPVSNWGSEEDMVRYMESFKYVICLDIYLSDTTYFADLILPECQYLERLDPPPNAQYTHHTPGDLETPWAVTIRQPVVPAKDNCPSSMEIILELTKRVGKLPNFYGLLNSIIPLTGDNALDVMGEYRWEEILDRIYKQWTGHGLNWFKKNGVYTWPRKPEEVYLYPFTDMRIPFYYEAPLIYKPQVEAAVKESGIEWQQIEDYQPLPGWEPCTEFYVKNPEYDLLPVYYTSPLNTDSFLQNNPWIDEINEADPYGYTIEINAETARRKGLKDGDLVVIENSHGSKEEGRIVCVEGVHPEVIASSSGCFNSRSEFFRRAQGKGVAFAKLCPVDHDHYDHLVAAYDQCVRCKITKKG
ncbi:MAG: molybdopterin-dependent oxidoreductase [Coriobacteriales bacterium]